MSSDSAQAAPGGESNANEVVEPAAIAPETKESTDVEVNKMETATSEVAGANLTMGTLTADGLTAKDIVCKAEGGMVLLGAMLVTAWMVPKKAQLDKCAPAGTETRILWTGKVGKLLSVNAKGDPKVKACVEKALAGGQPMLEGQCALTLVHGSK